MGEAKDFAPGDASDASSACDHEETQGAHAHETIEGRALGGARIGRRERGVKLKAADQVVSQDRELLPGTVGAVVVGRHDVQTKLPLQLADHLLVGSTSRHEVPQSPGRERLVGGDGRVLEVAVVGIEEVELVVPRASVMDPLTVDDDGHGIPAGVLPGIFEAFVSTRLDAQGTGLGLTVAEGIVQQHGGTISASNRPGGGARLEVTLRSGS